MLRFLDKYAAQFPIDLNTIEAYQLMNTNVVSVPPTTRYPSQLKGHPRTLHAILICANLVTKPGLLRR
jgi:hypothetical protein